MTFEIKESEEEKYLHACLRALQEDYAKQAQPYIDRLIKINACKTTLTIILNTDGTYRKIG